MLFLTPNQQCQSTEGICVAHKCWLKVEIKPTDMYSTLYSALTLLVGWQEGHPACKKTEWWGAGMVICLERGADLHTAKLMPLPLTVSSKIQVGFTFLIPAHPGSPGQRAIKQVCVCVCVFVHDIK